MKSTDPNSRRGVFLGAELGISSLMKIGTRIVDPEDREFAIGDGVVYNFGNEQHPLWGFGYLESIDNGEHYFRFHVERCGNVPGEWFLAGGHGCYFPLSDGIIKVVNTDPGSCG